MDIKINDILIVGPIANVKIKVRTCVNYGMGEDNWYIQGERLDNGQQVYVKQVPDKVTLTKA